MIVLGYWDARGIGESIRYLLHYTQTEFTDKRYQLLDIPGKEKGEWLKEKHSHGLDFPNMPYYIDGTVKLTQSLAILRHIARKHKLDGSSEIEKQRIDLMEQQLDDFKMTLARTAYDPKFEELKVDLIKQIPEKFKEYSDFLGTRKWLAGDKITYADFLAYEAFDFYRLLVPNCLKGFPNLDQYMKRFEELPAIKKYMTSGKFHRLPIFGNTAFFGGKRE